MTAIADLPDIRPSLLLDFANSGRVDPRIQCTRASSATCFGPDGKLRTVAANTPRIDYDPATGKCLGLLVEEARTNLLTHSATFSSSTWIKTRSIISAATVIAPDGISFAEKLSEDTQNGAHYIYKNASFTVGSIYTLSIFAKKSERSVINISSGGTSGTNALFDISAGTVLSAGNNASANIRKCGEDWFLCSISFSATNAGSQTCVIGVGDNAGYQGDGVSGIYVWGVQLEVGSFPSSYIPTEGTAVTRAMDAIIQSGFTWTNWASGLTIFIEADTPSAWPSDATLLAFSKETSQVNQIDIRYAGSGVATRTRAGGSTIASTIHTGIPLSGKARVALAVNATTFSSSANGSEAYSVTATFSPTELLNRLAIGVRSLTNNPLSGRIQRISIYPTALTAAQIKRLTA